MQNKQLNILLLEDNPDHVELFLANLELTSFASADITQSQTLKEGLSLLEINQYDLLFLDLSLTDSDIHNTLGCLKDLKSYCPVIVITSLDDKATLLDIINKGADDCLPKSEINDSLLERVIQFNLDRWKLKQKLVDSEKKYQDLYNNSPEMHISVDAKTAKVIACNHTLVNKIGYTVEQIIGRSVFDLYHPNCLSEVENAFNHFISSGRIENTELELKHKDGRVIDVLLNASAVRDEQGHILHSRSTLIDISENRSLQRKLELMQYAIDHVSEAAYLIDQQANFHYVNQGAVKNLGFSKDELVNMSVPDIDPQYNQHVWESHWTQLKQKGSLNFESIHQHKSGHQFPVEISANYIEYKNKAYILSFSHDITERKHSEEQLNLLANVFTYAREGIIITDLDKRIINVNNAFTELSGYSLKESLGKNPNFISSLRHEKAYYQEMWEEINTNGFWQGEIWDRNKNGSQYVGLLSISTISDNQGKPCNYLGIFSDISQQVKKQEKLQHLIHYDALTNLPNRLLFADRLRLAMAQANRHQYEIALAYFDLDGFKDINDEHGHDIGDKLLVIIAERMKQVLREEDTIARIGGDEFAAIISTLPDKHAVTPFLTRLLESISQPVKIGDIVLTISTSAGVSYYPQKIKIDADQLLRQSDQSMCQAKLSGKNTYLIFDTEQDEVIREQQQLLREITKALDNDEFVLYYQPKVNIRHGKVVGVEALIRWNHPNRGLLFPDEFLPAITDHPLSIKLDEWVIIQALKQLDVWNTIDFHLPISINAGAMTLAQESFITKLENSLNKFPNVNKKSLSIEILETSYVNDLENISALIKTCAKLGINFALDDFGTGYSSLVYLKHLPVTQLKMDKSYVLDILDNPEDLAILDGVITFAYAFNREPIAEGVETIKHGLMILKLGCELAQGYAIARPMPADNLIDWEKNWQCPQEWMSTSKVDRDDVTVLYAYVEHNAWVNSIEQYLINRDDDFEMTQVEHCRFGQWMRTTGKRKYGQTEFYKQVDQCHHELHQRANLILEYQTKGMNDKALEEFSLLQLNSERLIDLLDHFIHQ